MASIGKYNQYSCVLHKLTWIACIVCIDIYSMYVFHGLECLIACILLAIIRTNTFQSIHDGLRLDCVWIAQGKYLFIKLNVKLKNGQIKCSTRVSCLQCPNSLHFNSLNLLWDNGTFGSVLSSIGFKVETDVGINERFAPFWLLGTSRCNLIFDSLFDQ